MAYKDIHTITGSDESYTYKSLVEPLIPYIELFKNRERLDQVTIWCPFDVRQDKVIGDFTLFRSNYIEVLEDAGFKVISSHLLEGQDFFKYEPTEHYDIIISNPPFKNKKDFFKRAVKLNKPFALLSPGTWMNDGGPYDLFKSRQLQLLMPNRRAKFFNKNGCIGKSPAFKAVYYCSYFLDTDIQWFELITKYDK